MARGWESKAIEQQQDEARAAVKSGRTPLTPEQIAAQQKRQTLELSRKQIVQQLDAATNSRHRQMLEAALKELDAQLGAVK
jgi:hypothetical protein